MKKGEFKNLLVLFVLKYFTAILIVVILLILFLGWLIFIRPAFSEMRQVGSLDYDNKIEQLESKRQELSYLKELDSEYQDFNQSELKKLLWLLPPISDLPNIYRQMEDTARDLNLELVSVGVVSGGQSASLSSVNKLQEVNLTVNFKGIKSYFGLKSFLDSIEKNVRILDLASVTFSPASDLYSLNFKTYYLSAD